jgi:hypothetical protein
MKMGIESFRIVVSLDELIEIGGYDPPDERMEYNFEYRVELRDIIDRLPNEIIRLGQKRIDGDPLTSAERKRLERFRKIHRDNGYENKSLGGQNAKYVY